MGKEVSIHCPAAELCQTLADTEFLKKKTIPELYELADQAFGSPISRAMIACEMQTRVIEKSDGCDQSQGSKNLVAEFSARAKAVKKYYTEPNPN